MRQRTGLGIQRTGEWISLKTTLLGRALMSVQVNNSISTPGNLRHPFSLPGLRCHLQHPPTIFTKHNFRGAAQDPL